MGTDEVSHDPGRTLAMKRNLEDYETTLVTDEKGHQTLTTTYRGDYFEISLEKDQLGRFKNTCLLLVVVSMFLHIGGGFVANPGMYQFYVAIPYVLAFLPLFHMVLGTCYLPGEKRKYRRGEIRDSFERIRVASITFVILSAIGVLSETTFILFPPVKVQMGLDLIYIILELLAIIPVVLVIIKQSKISIWNSNTIEPH